MRYAADLLVFQKSIELLEEILRLSASLSRDDYVAVGGGLRSTAVRIAGRISEACNAVELQRGDLIDARAALAGLEYRIQMAEMTKTFSPHETLRFHDLRKYVEELLNRLIATTPAEREPEWLEDLEEGDDFDDPLGSIQ